MRDGLKEEAFACEHTRLYTYIGAGMTRFRSAQSTGMNE